MLQRVLLTLAEPNSAAEPKQSDPRSRRFEKRLATKAVVAALNDFQSCIYLKMKQGLSYHTVFLGV